ncbi:MAG: NAD(P)-dependent alcohol dehydrogenase [Caldilinea sp. CFX5]|nr:NAD(P)-dependent alcohol dehydrogenase [Caldilinea sp. CFX5]
MKAIVYHEYGSPDVLKVEEIATPTPKEDELLVRVHATSVNPAEWYAMTGLYIARMDSGWRKPKDNRLGVDFAGVVEAVGSHVKRFRPGDAVFGARHGAFAEYLCVREERAVVLKPENITFEQAASVPTAALTALQGLRDHGQLQPGQQVLINGASGGVGTFAVQIAKALGAEVTGVCSTRNVAIVRSLGADHVIDYSQEDFTRCGRRYDLLLDVAGSRSWWECKRVLTPKATCVIVGAPKGNRWIGPLRHVIDMRLASLLSSRTATFFVAKVNPADLVVLQALLASGQVTPVIDRRYTLADLPAAMCYLGDGHAQGKIVVTMV